MATTTSPTLLATSRVGALLRAEDLGRARRFYSEVLGLEIDDYPGGAMFSARAGEGTGFAVYERPGMPAPENTTLGFEVGDFDAVVHELRSRGIVFEEYDIPEMGLKTVDGVVEMDGRRSAWFLDTEGNIVSINEVV